MGYSGYTNIKPIEERLDKFLESVDRMERQTEQLIWLTKAIVGLTVALLLLTAFLCCDAYHHRAAVDGVNFTDHSTTKQP